MGMLPANKSVRIDELCSDVDSTETAFEEFAIVSEVRSMNFDYRAS